MKKPALPCGLAILLGSTLAWAQALARPDKVGLTLPQCAELPFDGSQLKELFEVELRAVGIEKLDTSHGAESPPETGRTALVVLGVRDCKLDASEIELRLVEPGSGATAERTMPIADIALEMRPRAIAIGMIEMVNASWKVIAPRPADPPVVVPTSHNAQSTALRPAVGAASGERRVDSGTAANVRPDEGVHTGVGAALTAWSFPSQSTALLGPGAALSLGSGHFRGSIGGHAAFGEVLAKAGAVDVRWISGYIGAGLRGSGAFAAMVEPRLYLGYGWASGNAEKPDVEASTEGRLIVAAMLSGGLRSELSESWDLLADLELGATLRGVSFFSDVDQAAGLSGVILGAQVGVELKP